MVTRPKDQAMALIRPLEELGAQIVSMPAIEIAPPLDPAPLDQALANLERYDWVVLTSVNGVESVRRRMEELRIPAENLKTRHLAVIGPATGAALAASFRAPDVVPGEYVSEAIAEALGDVRGKRFLLARADIARRDLAEILLAEGAVVDEVPAYRIVRPTSTELPTRAPDVITLTSSAAVRGTRDALASAGHEAWMSRAALICIGPITAATVRELGYEPAVVANEYTVPGLIEALTAYVKERRVGQH
jgi:uroporphyrinogen-III synthase